MSSRVPNCKFVLSSDKTELPFFLSTSGNHIRLDCFEMKWAFLWIECPEEALSQNKVFSCKGRFHEGACLFSHLACKLTCSLSSLNSKELHFFDNEKEIGILKF